MADRPIRDESRATVAAILVLCVGSMLYWVGCAPRFMQRPFFEGPAVVRVVVFEGVGVDISSWSGSGVRVQSSEQKHPLLLSKGRLEAAAGGGVDLFGVSAEGPVEWRAVSRLDVASEDWISVGGTPYPGRLDVTGDDGIRVVNVVGLETYLRGVVPHEIGFADRTTLEAVKAQAVVSRTYAVRTMGRKGGLQATVMDQVYRGAQGWNRWSDKAIGETRGQLVTLNGSPALTVFHSSCAGATDAIEDIWRGRGSHDHLRGVKDLDRRGRPFCEGSKYHRWSDTWTDAEVEKTLRAHLPRETAGATLPAGSPGKVALKIRRRSNGGRVVDAELTAWGEVFRLEGERIRWVLRRPSGGILRSAVIDRFESRDGGGLRVEGRGWGHGIGMCQVGALERARRGSRWREILEHYYDGIKIERMPDVN